MPRRAASFAKAATGAPSGAPAAGATGVAAPPPGSVVRPPSKGARSGMPTASVVVVQSQERLARRAFARLKAAREALASAREAARSRRRHAQREEGELGTYAAHGTRGTRAPPHARARLCPCTRLLCVCAQAARPVLHARLHARSRAPLTGRVRHTRLIRDPRPRGGR